MREDHIVDDNPDNDINTPSLSKTDDDRKLDEKNHVEDKHKQNADSSETVGYQSQSSASHRSTEKRNIATNDNDKLNGQNQIQRHRQIIIKKSYIKIEQRARYK